MSGVEQPHRRRRAQGDRAVGEALRERPVVRDEADAAARVTQRRQQAEQLAPGAPVLAERRLVEDEQRRRGGQRGGHRETSLLTAGQRERVRLGEAVRGGAARGARRRDVRRLAPSRPARRGPSSSSSRTDPVRNWCSGSWNTVPTWRTSSRAGQRAIGSSPWPASSASPAITRPVRGARRPGQRAWRASTCPNRSARRMASASDERTRDVHVRERVGSRAGVAERDPLGHHQRLGRRASRARRRRRRMPGHPDTDLGELGAELGGRRSRRRRRRPPRRRPRARRPGPRAASRLVDAVLDEEEGRAGALEDARRARRAPRPRCPGRGWLSARRA